MNGHDRPTPSPLASPCMLFVYGVTVAVGIACMHRAINQPLSGSVVPVTEALAATTPVATVSTDIPKLADDFAKKMNLVGPVVCTPTAIDGPRFVCMTPVNPGVTVAPTSFFCAPESGCWVPPGPAPEAPTAAPAK